MITSDTIINHVEKIIFSKRVWILFFFFSFIIFSPFFIHGNCIVSTLDSIFNHYPNILFGHELLREGKIPLWNPYLFGGIDFTTSMHHHMLNPANWILALFPKEYVFLGLTFIEFVEIAFIGLLSFKIFEFIQPSRIVSLVSATLVQLSGFTWFTTSTFIGVEFFLLSVLFIYLIISYDKRRPITNFILMALISAGMFLEGHVAYIAAFFFPIIAVQIFWHIKKMGKIRGNPNIIFAAACLFGLGMALFRLYPILVTPVDKIISPLPHVSFCSNGYRLLSGLIPAVFGIDLSTSMVFFQKMKIEGHIQFHCLLYFGLPTAIFLIFSLMGCFQSKISASAWILLILIFGSLTVFQPAQDLLDFIFSPFLHPIIFRVAIAFLIFAIFFFSIKMFYENKVQLLEKNLRIFPVLWSVTLIFFGSFFFHLAFSWGSLSMQFTSLIRLGIMGLFIFMIWAGVKFPTKLSAIKSFNNVVLLIISASLAVVAAIFIYSYSHALAPSLYHVAVLAWSFAILLLVRLKKLTRFYLLSLSVAVLFSAFVAIVQNPGQYLHVSSFVDMVYPLMGALAFTAVLLVLWEIFASLVHGKINHRAFFVFISLFLIGDLIFFLKIYSYSGGLPFVKQIKLYPELTNEKIQFFNDVLEDNKNGIKCFGKNNSEFFYVPDFKNYRVNYPGNYLGYSYHSAFSNAFIGYHVRTIGGIDSVVHQSFLDYLEKFVELNPTYFPRGMVFPGVEDLRLEELFGIKYSFPTSNEIKINQNALPRFSAFSNFLVMNSNDELTGLLRSGDFRAHETVILDQFPEGLQPGYPVRAEKLEYESVGTDKIVLNLNQKKPQIVLFNDTFHEEWTATWNENALPILLANGRFMAVAVPAGLGTLEFNFHPKMFFLLIKVSLILGALLLALGIYAFFSKAKERL